jgi:periplasmic protein TonB
MLIVVGSILLHGAMLAGFAVVSEAIMRSRTQSEKLNERLEIAVIDKTPPPPPPEPTPKEETHKAPAPVAKTLPAAPEVKNPDPLPDPINRPEAEAKPTLSPRRIVGLSLESTTVGGSGPAFATGNTRMGATDRVAHDPTEASRPLTQQNRISTRVPTAKATFKPPQRVTETKPEYPSALRTQGIEADVVLAVVIAVDGTVKTIEVVKGPAAPEFAAAAVAAAKIERYEPATKDGVPIEQMITFTVRFRLTDY